MKKNRGCLSLLMKATVAFLVVLVLVGGATWLFHPLHQPLTDTELKMVGDWNVPGSEVPFSFRDDRTTWGLGKIEGLWRYDDAEVEYHFYPICYPRTGSTFVDYLMAYTDKRPARRLELKFDNADVIEVRNLDEGTFEEWHRVEVDENGWLK